MKWSRPQVLWDSTPTTPGRETIRGSMPVESEIDQKDKKASSHAALSHFPPWGKTHLKSHFPGDEMVAPLHVGFQYFG